MGTSIEPGALFFKIFVAVATKQTFYLLLAVYTQGDFSNQSSSEHYSRCELTQTSG